ncbi:MAG: hypothetical protein QOE75_1732 [Solirubrobacterales bacterium]|jgi:uncharacterized membrane protein HdeD (DUF308 family)|nr:hypothetical protein [Solirubrobacterales bacterium]
MEAPPSAARLYASVVGALLLVVGIAGFFGAVEVDAGRNLLYAGTGVVGLFAASYAARPFAIAAGWLYTVLAVWGFALGAGEEIVGLFPADPGDDWLRLAIGLLGLAAAAGTERRRSGRRLEARADAAGEGA